MSACNPHGHDVLADGLGDLARKIDALRAGVNDDFGEHLGVIAFSSASRVSRVEDVVKTIDDGLYHANEVICREVLF